MLMSITRSADMAHTPDVRTRVIVPTWAASITVEFAKPIMREQILGDLLAAAGLYIGVGDWRPEKGAGSYGQFRLGTLEEFQAIAKTAGRSEQVAAMASPEFYDEETAELFGWFETESTRRGFKVVS
jgi:hypothetical protein